MRQEQEIDENQPLLMDLNDIEIVMTDHLQTLGGIRSTLQDMRTEIQHDQDTETISFEREVRDRLDHLQLLAAQSQESLLELLQRQNPPVNAQVRAEGISDAEMQDERHIVEQDVDFMEGGDEEEEVIDEQPADQPEDAPDSGPSPPPDVRYDEEAIARQIEVNIRNVQQTLSNFEGIVHGLEEQHACPPRNFDHGRINRSQERYMKCAFCEAVGTHYSDSCTILRDANSRRQAITDANKCILCLEYVCSRDRTCKKYNTLCVHCRQLGHHSALCELPERSDIIRARLENARQGRKDCLNRLLDLNRELELYRERR
ncbi:hypothetical protein ANCDUO_00198 [Ancylostoma duodenale]|uniref:Zinc knuckle n=1 Tax=Ancylostoma duodenale TaxID=51022 RepID=A0A0C2E220_9BILA|nr:hypothetical protein ANCDUO_00198 [Ancylostoma duodenale]